MGWCVKLCLATPEQYVLSATVNLPTHYYYILKYLLPVIEVSFTNKFTLHNALRKV